MILKLIIKKDRKLKNNRILVWIQKHKEFEEDVQQLFNFFKDNLKIVSKHRLSNYYKVTSDNPAIMMSFFSALQEILPDIYFKSERLRDMKETFNLE